MAVAKEGTQNREAHEEEKLAASLVAATASVSSNGATIAAVNRGQGEREPRREACHTLLRSSQPCCLRCWGLFPSRSSARGREQRRKPCHCSGHQEQSGGYRNHRRGCRRLAQSLLLSYGLSSSYGMSRLELLLLLRVVGAEVASAARAVVGAGLKSQLLRFTSSCCYGYCERDWELRFWLPSVRVEAERTL
ncbi:uncharacterized protein DS421_19g651830 [Arachis hypogaea]|uniref:Uncharacterized protein n=1 Tax=Arachis hypogaea TaxID=3818 RepID=A0A6B9V7N9_ARAHY|nr:uncharacterized protein DS421_19g651830 [Arachis hypogaea]